MPHTRDILPGGRYAVVSCHVERPLDDEVWERFSALQERAPGGFRIAALMRPPEPAAGEDEPRWHERARQAAGHGVSLFCGGGWYMDTPLAEALAELGYADCTATAFRPRYLAAEAPRLGARHPCYVELPSGRRLLEFPTTHSIGMLARGLLGPFFGPVVHAYFHDTDLLDSFRSAALRFGLAFLAAKRTRTGSSSSPATTASKLSSANGSGSSTFAQWVSMPSFAASARASRSTSTPTTSLPAR